MLRGSTKIRIRIKNVDLLREEEEEKEGTRSSGEVDLVGGG